MREDGDGDSPQSDRDRTSKEVSNQRVQSGGIPLETPKAESAGGGGEE